MLKIIVMLTAFSLFSAPVMEREKKPIQTITLEEAHSLIVGDQLAEKTQLVRSAQTKEEKDDLKKRTLDFATFSGRFAVKNSEGLLEHSGLLCLDFDHLDDVDVIKKRLHGDPRFPTHLIFRSPSGDGVKMVVALPGLDASTHKDAWEMLTQYFSFEYGMTVDPATKDVARACFLCHDPDAFLAISEEKSPFDVEAYIAKNQRIKEKAPKPIKPLKYNDTVSAVESVIGEIEARGIDITADFDDWIRIGFAFSHEFGEAGRDYYQRVSQFFPHYTRQECDKKYTNCLKTNKNQIGIGTFFFFVKQAGISINSGAHSAQSAQVGGEALVSGNPFAKLDIPTVPHEDFYAPALPSISKDIQDGLPTLFQCCLDGSHNAVEADVRLMSAMAVVSSAMPSVYGTYSGMRVFPNIYSIIDGPASSMKGKSALAQLLGQPIHDQLAREFESEKAEYLRECREWKDNNMEGPEPQRPRRKLFFVPANITDSAFIQQIADNQGTATIIEMELDTVNGAMKSKFGNLSAILRKAAHHEMLSLRRRTDDELIEVQNPRVSLCIAGTHDQIANFLGSPQNGLFSRILFVVVPYDPTWISPWTSEDELTVEEKYTQIGQNFFEGVYTPLLEAEPIRFFFTQSQQLEFDRVFAATKQDYAAAEGMLFVPTIHRMGLMAYRLAMIMATLRYLEKEECAPQKSLICDADSFEVSMKMADSLLEHASFVYSHLPNVVSGSNAQVEKFYAALPDRFNREDYRQVAQKLGMVERTVDRYVRNLTRTCRLEHDAHNLYKKIK